MAHEHFLPMVDAVEDAAGNRLVDKWFVLEQLKPVEVAAYLGIAPFEMLRKNESVYSYELSEEDRGWIKKVYERDVVLYGEVVTLYNFHAIATHHRTQPANKKGAQTDSDGFDGRVL